MSNSTYIDEHKKLTIELDRHGHLSIMSSHRLTEHIKIHIQDIMTEVRKSTQNSPIKTAFLSSSDIDDEYINETGSSLRT